MPGENSPRLVKTKKDLVHFVFDEDIDLDFVAEEVGDRTMSATRRKKHDRARRELGDWLYVHMLLALTHNYYPVEEAKTIWEHVLEHREEMANKLERGVDIVVGALDYLVSERKAMDKPLIVNERRFANVAEVALRDSLTGLYDHQTFRARLDVEIARFERYGSEFGIAMIDIDHFKEFNDTFGHPAGDQVLRHISRTIQSEIRQLDIAARYGGEEFSLLLPQTPLEDALVLADRLRRRVQQRPPPSDNGVTISAGVAGCPRDAQEAERLVEVADNALYCAKRSGRNCVWSATGPYLTP